MNHEDEFERPLQKNSGTYLPTVNRGWTAFPNRNCLVETTQPWTAICSSDHFSMENGPNKKLINGGGSVPRSITPKN